MGTRLRRLRRAELPSDTVELARALIGRVVVREHRGERLAGRIVETEAYPVGDAAAHSFRGETARNRSLFLRRGHAYVYFCYGCWFMLNVSSETAGVGAGVLLRALEPIAGLATMARLRGTTRPTDLARGPGRVAQALAVDRGQDGLDLCAPGPLWLATNGAGAGPIASSVRIGITREAQRVLRFYERGNPHVSGSRALRR
ncbi:MAG: DNA-3-methyladenine glycosylase [Deltaproteobacteria bacterium]|nr:DNA-3-methyladenine glycosylase [Deltaproteobacteria bacterium]